MKRWAQALTLEERMELLRKSGRPAVAVTDEARAQLARWREAAPARFAQDSLPEELLLQALSVAPETLLQAPPPWLAELEAAEAGFAQRPQAPGAAQIHAARDTLAPFFPLIALHAARLQADFGNLRDLSIFSELDAEALTQAFLTPILDRLALMAGPAFTAEGQGPGFLARFPSLARAAQETLAQWRDASFELVSRLRINRARIAEELGTSGRLNRIGAPAGDFHGGGRAVRILGFSDGTQLVYKPHPLSIDLSFQDFLGWLNARGVPHPFRRIRAIDEGSYGWVDFLAAEPCASPQGVSAFHYRLGSLLAVLYLLGGTDIHFENIIASGDQPIVIDLEALFHVYLRFGEPANASDQVYSEALHGVASVGILPWPVQVSRFGWFDSSALGGSSFRLHPVFPPEAAEVADLASARPHFVTSLPKHRPFLAGEPGPAAVDHAAFLAGYEDTFGLLVRHRAELAREDGPLAAFRQDKIRVVLQGTHVYQQLWTASWQPAHLRDGLARSRYFDALWVNCPPSLASLVEAQKRQLLEGDIPYFAMLADGEDLLAADGHRVGDLGGKNGWRTVAGRVAALAPEEGRRQLRYIHAAFGFTQPRADGAIFSAAETLAGSTLATPLALASAAARALQESAVRFGPTASWLSAEAAPDVCEAERSLFTVGPLANDLQTGIAGPALFLAYLHRVTGEPFALELARACLHSFRENRRHFGPPSLGAFSGMGSEIYLYAHLGSLWREPALFAQAEEAGRELEPLVATDEVLDVRAGTAGFLLALLALARVSPAGPALALARRCGEHLLGRAGGGPEGPVWAERPYGFAQGSTGIAHALFQLGRAARDARFESAGLAALRRDPRPGPDGTWARGAAGFALARLATQDESLRAGALASLAASTVTTGDGLAFGELGRLEALRAAGLAQLAAAQARLLTEIGRRGFVSAPPHQRESAGLLGGMSGLGYGALRLAHPELVPSVLLLEAPRS